LDLDKPDDDVIGESEDGESEDGESEDGDCLRQKLYVAINVIPVARLEQQRINTTSKDTIVNCAPEAGSANNLNSIRFERSCKPNPKPKPRGSNAKDFGRSCRNTKSDEKWILELPFNPLIFKICNVVQLLPGSKFPQFRFGTRATTSGRATTESGSQQQPIIRIGYSLDHSIEW
jgi:hypothetical protein